jgi:hypothetical protein
MLSSLKKLRLKVFYYGLKFTLNSFIKYTRPTLKKIGTLTYTLSGLDRIVKIKASHATVQAPLAPSLFSAPLPSFPIAYPSPYLTLLFPLQV